MGRTELRNRALHLQRSWPGGAHPARFRTQHTSRGPSLTHPHCAGSAQPPLPALRPPPSPPSPPGLRRRFSAALSQAPPPPHTPHTPHTVGSPSKPRPPPTHTTPTHTHTPNTLVGLPSTAFEPRPPAQSPSQVEYRWKPGVTALDKLDIQENAEWTIGEQTSKNVRIE